MVVEAAVRTIQAADQARFAPLFEELDRGEIIMGHGPTGTELRAYPIQYPAIGGHNVALSNEGCEQLRRVHERYADAGAILIESFTWGPSPRILQQPGLPSELSATLNAVEQQAAQAAANSAYERTGIARYVVDTARPAEDCYRPTPEDVTDKALLELHLEQARAFYEAGSEGVLLQTFPSLREIRAAVRAFGLYGIPIVGISAYAVEAQDGTIQLPSGDSLADVVDIARQHGAMAGVNCVSPEIGVKAVDQVIATTTGNLRLYVGLNGLSNHPHDPIYAEKHQDEITAEAQLDENRASLLAGYRSIVEAIRRANEAGDRKFEARRRIGAVLASCCFTNPSRTADIAEIVAQSVR